MASERLSKLRARVRAGFILGNTLIAFIVALYLVPLCMACIAPLRGIMEFRRDVQDEISAVQLRRLLLVSDDIEISGESLVFTYQQKSMELSQGGHHVILKPGTQIYFTDTEGCRFECMEGVLEIVYERNGNEYRKVLAKMP